MGRAEYSDDFDRDWELIMWRGAVDSAIRGRRGQAFFKDLLKALDALPKQELIAEELEASDGCVCALGALGKARALDMSKIDPEDHERVAALFGIADALAREVVFVNDEGGHCAESPEQRFRRVRRWVLRQIQPEPGIAA